MKRIYKRRKSKFRTIYKVRRRGLQVGKFNGYCSFGYFKRVYVKPRGRGKYLMKFREMTRNIYENMFGSSFLFSFLIGFLRVIISWFFWARQFTNFIYKFRFNQFYRKFWNIKLNVLKRKVIRSYHFDFKRRQIFLVNIVKRSFRFQNRFKFNFRSRTSGMYNLVIPKFNLRLYFKFFEYFKFVTFRKEIFSKFLEVKEFKSGRFFLIYSFSNIRKVLTPSRIIFEHVKFWVFNFHQVPILVIGKIIQFFRRIYSFFWIFNDPLMIFSKPYRYVLQKLVKDPPFWDYVLLKKFRDSYIKPVLGTNVLRKWADPGLNIFFHIHEVLFSIGPEKWYYKRFINFLIFRKFFGYVHFYYDLFIINVRTLWKVLFKAQVTKWTFTKIRLYIRRNFRKILETFKVDYIDHFEFKIKKRYSLYNATVDEAFTNRFEYFMLYLLFGNVPEERSRYIRNCDYVRFLTRQYDDVSKEYVVYKVFLFIWTMFKRIFSNRTQYRAIRISHFVERTYDVTVFNTLILDCLKSSYVEDFYKKKSFVESIKVYFSLFSDKIFKKLEAFILKYWYELIIIPSSIFSYISVIRNFFSICIKIFFWFSLSTILYIVYFYLYIIIVPNQSNWYQPMEYTIYVCGLIVCGILIWMFILLVKTRYFESWFGDTKTLETFMFLYASVSGVTVFVTINVLRFVSLLGFPEFSNFWNIDSVMVYNWRENYTYEYEMLETRQVYYDYDDYHYFRVPKTMNGILWHNFLHDYAQLMRSNAINKLRFDPLIRKGYSRAISEAGFPWYYLTPSNLEYKYRNKIFPDLEPIWETRIINGHLRHNWRRWRVMPVYDSAYVKKEYFAPVLGNESRAFPIEEKFNHFVAARFGFWEEGKLPEFHADVNRILMHPINGVVSIPNYIRSIDTIGTFSYMGPIRIDDAELMQKYKMIIRTYVQTNRDKLAKVRFDPFWNPYVKFGGYGNVVPLDLDPKLEYYMPDGMKISRNFVLNHSKYDVPFLFTDVKKLFAYPVYFNLIQKDPGWTTTIYEDNYKIFFLEEKDYINWMRRVRGRINEVKK